MSNLILIRHGQSLYNVKESTSLDSDLTEIGKKQLRLAGKYLKSKDVGSDYVGFVSPYYRTLHSAKIIHEETGIKFWVTPGPREIMCIYDRCEVRNWSQEFPEFDWSAVPEEGFEFHRETINEYLDRLDHFLEGIQDYNAVVVSHGSPVTSMMELKMGLVRDPCLFNFADNGSLTLLEDDRLCYYNILPSQ